MTEEQKDKILEEYHGYKEIATLNEYARVEGAIIDPYGMEDDDYERCFEQIARLVKKIWQERLGGNKMIGIGSDHGGYALKQAVLFLTWQSIKLRAALCCVLCALIQAISSIYPYKRRQECIEW